MSVRDDLEKHQALLQMLDTSGGGRGLVMIHLDPRHEGVIVPPRFQGDPVLRLNLAYGFNLPALDLNDEGVYAVLSFSGKPFGCTIPWGAIFAMTLPDENHVGYSWSTSIPSDITLPATKVDEPEKPKLQVIKGGKE